MGKITSGLFFFIFTWLILSANQQSFADNKLKLFANIRFRYEFQDNFNQKFYGDNPKRGASDDGFLLGRFQVGFDYQLDKNIRLYVSMVDSDAWDVALPNEAFYSKKFGHENSPNKDRWELGDSYLEVKNPFGFSLVIKGGRQRIIYGDNRVFGPGEWGNYPRWIWDAVSGSFKFKNNFIDLYYGRTLLHEPNKFSLNHRHGFASSGLYSHFEFSRFFLSLEPFLFTKIDRHNRYSGEDRKTGDLNSYYVGIRGYGNGFPGFDYDFTYLGERGDFADDDIKAYGYHLLLAYNCKKLKSTPRISLEYSFASGDSDPKDSDHETFGEAFGARDKMYGRMNLFYWQNIKDAQINLELNPKKWIYLKAEFHKFWLAERKDAWYLNEKEYRDKTGHSGDGVGKELDIVVRFNLPRDNQIQLGFGHFWPDEFAKNMASTKQANWVFWQWEYKFAEKIF